MNRVSGYSTTEHERNLRNISDTLLDSTNTTRIFLRGIARKRIYPGKFEQLDFSGFREDLNTIENRKDQKK